MLMLVLICYKNFTTAVTLTAMTGGGFVVENSKPVQHAIDETGELWFMRINTGL
jgi:hypothetical protein